MTKGVNICSRLLGLLWWTAVRWARGRPWGTLEYTNLAKFSRKKGNSIKLSFTKRLKSSWGSSPQRIMNVGRRKIDTDVPVSGSSIYLELVKAAVPTTHIPSSSRYKLGVIMSKIWMLCIFLARSIFVDWESDSTTRLLSHSIVVYLHFYFAYPVQTTLRLMLRQCWGKDKADTKLM